MQSVKSGIRSSLFSGIISALVSAAATARAYPESGMSEALLLGGGAGLIIGTLIPLSLFLTGTFLINVQAFRRLPYVLFMGATSSLILLFTMLIYFAVGLLMFPARVMDSSQLLLALGLSGFLSVTMSFSNAIRQFAGPGVVSAIISGKYHRAFETDSVFVFVDLVSSTTLAERLGSERFFQMINDFHSTVEACVTYYGGQIYKYMGDGMIAVWHAREAAQTFDCLLEISREISARRAMFESRYGQAAEFTAGVHAGRVITGEIGESRKEIGYWGDVINTAARIQSACREFEMNILLSADFVRLLSPQHQDLVRPAGTARLRGKEKEVELFCLAGLSPSS